MTNKETITERLARLAGGPKSHAPKIEKIEKKQDLPKKEDKRKGNGGARTGSGRKPEEERKQDNRQGFQDFAEQEISVRLPDATGAIKELKMSRTQVIRMRLFEHANKGDLRAIEEFNERTMGKAMQPVGGDVNEPIVIKLDI